MPAPLTTCPSSSSNTGDEVGHGCCSRNLPGFSSLRGTHCLRQAPGVCLGLPAFHGASKDSWRCVCLARFGANRIADPGGSGATCRHHEVECLNQFHCKRGFPARRGRHRRSRYSQGLRGCPSSAAVQHERPSSATHEHRRWPISQLLFRRLGVYRTRTPSCAEWLRWPLRIGAVAPLRTSV